MSVAVRFRQPRELSQYHCLNDREFLVCAIFQILLGFFSIETMEQFPSRIAEPEERLAMLIEQIASIVTDLGGIGSVAPGRRTPRHRSPNWAAAVHGALIMQWFNHMRSGPIRMHHVDRAAVGFLFSVGFFHVGCIAPVG